MESLTRLVSESLARHGFDRPVDVRRLKWSRWFRCESHHSLLSVPSKPGVFAIAEEVMDLGSVETGTTHAVTSPLPVPRTEESGQATEAPSLKPEADYARRMLAVAQFFEADDMAFVLDRMLSNQNPMRARLSSGRYFVRFVVIEDQSQRRSITVALNQWILSSAEKATGIVSQYASSLELQTDTLVQAEARVGTDAFVRPGNARVETDAFVRPGNARVETDAFVRPASEASGPGTAANAFTTSTSPTTPHLKSEAVTSIHYSPLFPSGF